MRIINPLGAPGRERERERERETRAIHIHPIRIRTVCMLHERRRLDSEERNPTIRYIYVLLYIVLPIHTWDSLSLSRREEDLGFAKKEPPPKNQDSILEFESFFSVTTLPPSFPPPQLYQKTPGARPTRCHKRASVT
jgi:hypothetical protein